MWFVSVQQFCMKLVATNVIGDICCNGRDVLDHVARHKLKWQCSKTVGTGETADLSVFRFCFWEPAWCHDPSAKFPSPNLLPGQFLGVARSSGNEFTCHVLDLSKKCQHMRHGVLMRSDVRPRDDDDVVPRQQHAESPDSPFVFPSTVPLEFDPEQIFQHVDDEEQEQIDQAMAESEEPADSVVDDACSASNKCKAPSPTNIVPSSKRRRPSLDDGDDDSSQEEPSRFDMPAVETVVDDDDVLDDAEMPTTTSTLLSVPAIDFEDLPKESQDKLSGGTVHLNDNVHAAQHDDDGTFALKSEDGSEELGVEAVYDHFNRHEADGPAELDSIVKCKWDHGESLIRKKWVAGSHEWILACILKKDQPKFLVANPVDRTRSGIWAAWARQTTKAINRTIRRMR